MRREQDGASDFKKKKKGYHVATNEINTLLDFPFTGEK
jgi:hypothetical protein